VSCIIIIIIIIIIVHDRYSLRVLLVTAFVMSVKTIILTAVDNGTIRM
jgi:hypothetical protein